MQKRDAACLRLYPSPPPDKETLDHPEVGEISKGATYRVSLQAAIWDKHIFYNLLKDGESPWDMEYYGSLRSNLIEKPFLSVIKNLKPIDYFSTAIIRGQWLRNAVKFCEREGIVIDRKARKIESKLSQMNRYFIMPLIIKCKVTLRELMGNKQIEKIRIIKNSVKTKFKN